MPGINGVEMIHKLKHSSELKGVKIIVVTGLAREEAEGMGRLPADVPLLTKPIKNQDLKTAVEAELGIEL